jgi:hypothetical protein
MPVAVVGALLCELAGWYERERRMPSAGDVVSVAGFAIFLRGFDNRFVAPVCAVAQGLYGGVPVRVVEMVARLHTAGEAVE